MVKSWCVLILLTVTGGLSNVWAEEAGQLKSALDAKVFRQLADQVDPKDSNDTAGGQKGMLYLQAALRLDDTQADYLPDVLEMASNDLSTDYSDQIERLLSRYVTGNCDLEIATRAVNYLLDSKNTRDERESLLVKLADSYRTVNSFFVSDIYTQLGFLAAEKADLQNARGYLAEAYRANPYNFLAFSKLREISDDEMTLSQYMKYLRRKLVSNRYDFDNAYNFACTLYEYGLYADAAAGFEYCAKLYEYANPGTNLPVQIYLPWSLANYNTARGHARCLEIESMISSAGIYDLELIGTAYLAAEKIGDQANMARLAKAAEKAEAMADGTSDQVTDAQLAWYFSFVKPDIEKAMAWANKAYAANPDSPAVQAIFAYCLATSGSGEMATEVAGKLAETDQIAAMAAALAADSAGDEAGTVEKLKAAIKLDPGSVAAAAGRTMLKKNDAEYLPEYDSAILRQMLTNEMGDTIYPVFVPAEDIFAVKISTNGLSFAYGSQIKATVVVINKSSEPVVVSDSAFFRGLLKVDAKITGDISIDIPAIALKKFRPSEPIGPNQSVFVPIEVETPVIRKILDEYPQASLKIDLVANLDPESAFTSGKPLATGDISLARPGVKLTRQYLIQRLEVVNQGFIGQKIKVAQLFAGLLKEQQNMSRTKNALYKFTYIEPELLRSALVNLLGDDQWTVRNYTQTAMNGLDLDITLTKAVSDNLSAEQWPVRFTALGLLAQSQGGKFSAVLDWTLRYDKDQLVRRLAAVCGGKEK